MHTVLYEGLILWELHADDMRRIDEHKSTTVNQWLLVRKTYINPTFLNVCLPLCMCLGEGSYKES